jgi:protein-S-isoprenylcysteine O-methyltransferase Ste14
MATLNLTDTPTLLLFSAIILVSYLTLRVFTPPNPTPTNSTAKDRIFFYSTNFIGARQLFVILLGAYHGYIALTYPSPPNFCPRPENLNPNLFTWSPTSIICTTLILIAAPIRLLAFKQLGPNFTFKLAQPKNLVTTGLYKYVQHPSYITNITVMMANSYLIWRRDGVLACWLSESVLNSGWWKVVAVFFWGVAILAMRMRIVDEEKMMKETFGKEWEVWHARTKRFIPGVF